MQHAAELPKVPASRAILASVLALAIGAGAATGTYALIDQGGEPTPRVIVVESAAPSPNPDLRGSKASATGETATGTGERATAGRPTGR